MCSKWITDRLPTAEDADENGGVIAWTDDCWSAMRWQRVADEGFPWMRCPEPYVPPIDTSLAASIERIGRKFARGMACVDKPCDCYICDLERIIEAAKRWLTVEQQDKASQDRLIEGMEYMRNELRPSCGPSQGSEPGASGSNDPTPFAGSSHSVGEAELPDPGEGWELCSKNKGEQWCIVLAETQNEWLDGTNKLADFHRRRVVVTEPPDKTHYESDVWYYGKLERQWFWGTAGSVRSCWKNGITAWCHRLDGEDTPPQFALDWGKDRNE